MELFLKDLKFEKLWRSQKPFVIFKSLGYASLKQKAQRQCIEGAVKTRLFAVYYAYTPLSSEKRKMI